MRIQFSLSCQKGTVIPINYQSEISNWVFSVLANSDGDLSLWVQQQGFDLASKTFKLFTFSPLAIYPYEMDQVKQEFKLLGNQVKLGFSIYVNPVFEQQLVNLFRQVPLQLGTLDEQPAFFEVKHWQVLNRPVFKDTMQFKAVSPISVTTVEDVKTSNPYLLPDSPDYDISFFNHIIRRFKASQQYRSLAAMKLLDPSFAMHYKLYGQAKSRLIHLKANTDNIQQLRGFSYEFETSMSPAVMEFCFYAGFGEFPHLGFGYVDLK